MRARLALLGLLTLTVSLVAACDQSLFPTIAQIGEGATGTGNDTTPPPPSAIPTLSPAQASLRLGDTLRLVASNTAGAGLRWQTSQPTVVTILATNGSSALVQATALGSAVITASFTADPTRQGFATITVSP